MSDHESVIVKVPYDCPEVHEWVAKREWAENLVKQAKKVMEAES